MMKFFKNIKCLFGFHDWEDKSNRYMEAKECKYCTAKKVRLKMTNED